MSDFQGNPRLLRWARTRGNRRWSVKGFAAELGVHPRVIPWYESGEWPISLGMTRRWADACQVSLAMLYLPAPPSRWSQFRERWAPPPGRAAIPTGELR